jgi:hypothetical protein
MPKRKPTRTKPCDHCGEVFIVISSFQGVFCSYECKVKSARKRLGLTEKIPTHSARKRLRKLVAAEDHPVSIAFRTGDRDQLLAAIRSICRETKGGCWIPKPQYTVGDLGSAVPSGYQSVYINGRAIGLHRLSLETFQGFALGKVQCHHTCAVRACCNPDHLQPATMINNVLEMRERTALRKRIADLEQALQQESPDHPLLWPEHWTISPALELPLFGA